MSRPPTNKLLIHATRLADGLGSSAKKEHSVLIEDWRIVAVGPRIEMERQAPSVVEVVDLGNACAPAGQRQAGHLYWGTLSHV